VGPTLPASPEPIACRINALSPAERTWQEQAAERLLPAVVEIKELPRGYGFRLAAEPTVVTDATAWLMHEQRCCPFLSFSLRFSPTGRDVWMEAVGDARGKAYLKATYLPALAALHVKGA